MMSKKIATHDGLFHLDDLFACAILELVLENKGETATIIRTRDEELIRTADYVVDVGGLYDPTNFRFDHHQLEGAGTRLNGIPYASVGLVWKKYGEELCHSIVVATQIDTSFIQSLDADDNGIQLYQNLRDDVETFTIHDFFYAFRPTWKDDGEQFTKVFLELLPIARQFLLHKIKKTSDKLEAQNMVEAAYTNAEDKRLIVMDKPYPADEFLMEKPEPLYKVSINAARNAWGVKAIDIAKDVKQPRKDLPKEWAGLRDEELQRVTGVPDAIFCHKALFLATATSKEGALALAKLALEY